MSAESAAKAEAFRARHVPGHPIVLVNVWDVASAKVVAAEPGVEAIATASWSISAAHGVPDGEGLTRDELLAVVGRIAGAVDLPVTADLERGYGETPGDVADTIRAAIDHGVVGANIEDSLPDDGLRALDEQVARLAAVRKAAQEAQVPFVLNARTDALVTGGRLDDAIARGRAYLDAGADCIFILGVRDVATAERLVAALGTVSVLAKPNGPALRDLANAGVARISFGPGPMGVAMAALARGAAALAGLGELPPDLAFRP